jgi:tRNA nucleotidyltransferase/poly(A) polymerase
MRKNAKLIREISGERILGEFDKIVYKHGSTKVAFDLIERSDLDKALFGEKFHKDGFEYFDNLGLVSFYYVLATLGHKVPWKFYKERLKGEAPVTKALMTLEKHFDKFNESKPEAEIKWNVFLMLKTSPMLWDAEILPETASKVIDDMKAKKIPMKLGDIPVNGNDIMDKFGVRDEEIGNIMNKMYQDALMNKFDWKSKEKTLKYLETI